MEHEQQKTACERCGIGSPLGSRSVASSGRLLPRGNGARLPAETSCTPRVPEGPRKGLEIESNQHTSPTYTFDTNDRTNSFPMEANNHDRGSQERTSQMLMQMMSQLSEQMQALRAERDADREEVRTQIDALRSAIVTPTQTPHPPPPVDTNQPQEGRNSSADTEKSTKKKPTLPNPPKFDGTRRNFRPWYLEMRAKLSLDREAFRCDEELFAYIYARLEGTAQNMAAAYFEQGGSNGSRSPDQFLDYLNRRYGDPNAKSRALDRLRALRQKPDESFATFFPKFEKELADSGGGSWDDAVQINYLEGALNDRLRDRLISVPSIPADFNAFAELLLTIGSRLDSRDAQARQGRPNLSPRGSRQEQPQQPRLTQPVKADGPDRMDWEPTKIGQVSGRKYSGKDSSRQCQKERKCFRCNEVGHIAAYCTQGPLERPTGNSKRSQPKTKVARLETKRMDHQEQEDEGSSQYETASDDDSGNE